MISDNKVKKIQAKVNKLIKSGASKKSIGKLLNDSFKDLIHKPAISQIDYDDKTELRYNLKTGFTSYSWKKFKHELYKNVDKKKRINLSEIKEKIKPENIISNISDDDINSFMDFSTFKARLIVFKFQEIKTGKIFFSTVSVSKVFNTKDKIKELIQEEINNVLFSGYGQNKVKVRLLDISFRFFDFKKK